MVKKVIFLTVGISFLFLRNGYCDPISAGIAIFSGLSTIGGGIAAGAGALSAGIGGLGVGGLLAGAGLGLGAASLLGSGSLGDLASKSFTAPTTPTTSDAAGEAETKLKSKRMAALLSGGETTLTGPGGAPLLAGSTTSHTLLGAS